MEKTPSQRVISYLKSKQIKKKVVMRATGVSRQGVDKCPLYPASYNHSESY